jgi:hypothetical protein
VAAFPLEKVAGLGARLLEAHVVGVGINGVDIAGAVVGAVLRFCRVSLE